MPNNNDLIIATSGFLLKKNQYFTDFTEDDVTSDLIFNRDIVTSTNKETIDYYIRNDVYRSRAANIAYRDYNSEPTFEHYIALVDIVTDIVKEMDYITFFKLQAANTHLSNIAFQFCLDVTSRKFLTNFRDYSILPFSLRFTIDNGLTTTKSLDNMRLLEKNFSNTMYNSWDNLLLDLIDNKQAMLTFYKFIFADFY